MHRSIQRIFFSTLFVLYFLFPVDAQHFHFHAFSMKDVLPSKFMYRNFEDSKGYTWFLTDRGITRFDGEKSWIIGQAEGYLEGGAYHVEEDRSGQLWFISKNYRVYVYRNDSFWKVNSSERLSWIDIDKKGQITLMTREGKIFSVDKELRLKEIFSKSLTYQAYEFMSLDDGSFLMATNAGIWLRKNSGETRLLPADTYTNFVIPRLFRANGRIFITNLTGIYELINNKPRLLHLLGGKEVFDLELDTLHRCFWVGTTNELMRLELDGRPALKPAFSFPYPVSCVTLRKDGSVWVSTTTFGIYILRPEAVHYTDKIELSDETIRFVKRESDNLYFFRSNDYFYHVKGDRVEKRKLADLTAEEPYRDLNRVKTVSDTEVFVMSYKNISISRGKASIRPMPYRSAVEMFKGPRGLLMFCDGDVVLNDCSNVILTEGQRMWLDNELRKANNPIENTVPVFIEQDTIYYSSAQGLIKAYRKKERVVYSLIKLKGVISQVIADSGRLIVATETNGIYIITGKGTQNLNAGNVMLSDYCNNIFLRKPYLWATTNNGLFRINLQTQQVINYTAFDYLIHSEVNDIEFYHDSVYVATVGGVSVFPESAGSADIPPVYLEKIFINNKETALAENYTLDYLNNNISLLFCSPGYRSASNSRFRVVIDGNDRVDTSYYKEGNVQLFALMPGTYRLAIDVMNIDGVWSTRPVKLMFTITPPFWKTWWFISLIALGLMLVAAYVVWISVRRQREIQDYTRRIAESELKSLRLYMNPHFLFNSLTSLQSFVLTQKTGEANSFITKFSKLIRSVMTYSIKGELKLKEEVELLRSYLELESVRFSTEFEYDISCDPVIDTEDTIIPSLIIQPFIENAIKHGVTGISGRRCYIHVHFFMEKNNLYCTIVDNGKGRKVVKLQDKIHVSSGIKFTEERIKLLIEDKSLPVLTITDTTNDEAMPGTTVKVLVPVLNLTNL